MVVTHHLPLCTRCTSGFRLPSIDVPQGDQLERRPASAPNASPAATTVPVALDVRVEDELSDGVEVAAYYAVSELVTNTAKHAQAASVDVAVIAADGVLHIVAHDDGIGGADPTHGSGLVGLRDRIEALGGTISVSSPRGEGTAVEVALPLDRD